MAVAAARHFGSLHCSSAQKCFTSSSKPLSTVFAVPKISQKTELWNDAMLKGSELVGSTESEGNFAMMFNFGSSQKQLYLKTTGISHPLLQTAIKQVSGHRVNPKLFGIISLLLAKAAGHTSNSPNYEETLKNEGISSRQRKLADTLELYRNSFLIHTSVLNLRQEKDGEISKSLQQMNGLALLGGDFFAANASVFLTSIRENKVLNLVSKGFADFSESQFHWETDENGNPLPDHEKASAVWEHATYLEHSSLLAHGCEAMMVLAGHSENVGKVVGAIGKNLAMAIKAKNDMYDFEEISIYSPGTPFNLVLLPIIKHLESDRQLLDEIRSKGKDNIMNLDFQKIYSAVQDGNGMKEAEVLLNRYIETADKHLTTLGPSKSSDVLRNILRSL